MDSSRTETGAILDERTVQRSLKFNIVAGVFGVIFWWTISPGVVQLFALRLGAKNFHIALINTSLLVTLPIQVFSSYIVEKYRVRKSLWIWSSLISRSMWIPVILMPVFFGAFGASFKLWYLIIFHFLYALLINSTVATWFSWMTDIVPKEKSGQFWGHRFGYISLASVIVLPLIGLFLDWNIFSVKSFAPFAILMTVGIIAGYVDIYLHRYIPDPGMGPSREAPKFRELLAKPLKNRSFRRFLSALTYYSIIMSLYRPFIIVFFKQHFGMSYFQILMLSVAALVGSMIFSRVWGFLSDHFGMKPVLTVLFLGHGILPIVLLTTAIDMHSGVRLMILNIAWFIDCCFSSGAMIINQAYFNQSLPKENRSMYIAAFYSIVGLFAATAPLIGGYLLNVFERITPSLNGLDITNYHFLFLTGFVLTIPSAFLVRRMIGESLKTPHQIIGQMLFGRVMGISRWLNVIDQSKNEKRKLRLLDKIEKVRNPVAVPQLKKHLADPSEKVRERTRRTIEVLGIEEEAQQTIPLVKEISDPGVRKSIRRELKHPDASVRKNAIQKARSVLKKAA